MQSFQIYDVTFCPTRLLTGLSLWDHLNFALFIRDVDVLSSSEYVYSSFRSYDK